MGVTRWLWLCTGSQRKVAPATRGAAWSKCAGPPHTLQCSFHFRVEVVVDCHIDKPGILASRVHYSAAPAGRAVSRDSKMGSAKLRCRSKMPWSNLF